MGISEELKSWRRQVWEPDSSLLFFDCLFVNEKNVNGLNKK